MIFIHILIIQDLLKHYINASSDELYKAYIALEEEQTEETANKHCKDRIDFLKAREVKSTSKEGYAQGK